MPRHTSALATLAVLASVAFGAACSDGSTSIVNEADAKEPDDIRALGTFAVAGTGTHYFSTAVIHSQEQVDGGMIQRSTDIIRLEGDVDGFVLYHPTSMIDFAANTLTNTGTQIFSGTINGSEPVLLHDDQFRFQVQLSNGMTDGQIYLRQSADAPDDGSWFECDLTVAGASQQTAEGDAIIDYSGTCRKFGRS